MTRELKPLSDYRAAAHSAAMLFSLFDAAEMKPDRLERERRRALRRIRLYDLRKGQASLIADAKLAAYLDR